MSEYGEAYQLGQADKYRNRQRNHWKPRIELAHNLVDRYALPRLAGKKPEEMVVVDIGCSVGTFAIEFAKRGYRCYGVDSDPAALKVAKQLSAEEGVCPEFVLLNVADWRVKFPPIDIAVCFDLFEHLHDDELGAFLQSLRKQIPPAGSLVFYTFPTQYDYLFFGRPVLRIPLFLVKFLPRRIFERVVRAYASTIDTLLLLVKGYTYQGRIKHIGHCNPLTTDRLKDILERAGYEVLCLEVAQLYPFKAGIQKQFAKHPISYRNLYGVAMPRATKGEGDAGV